VRRSNYATRCRTIEIVAAGPWAARRWFGVRPHPARSATGRPPPTADQLGTGSTVGSRHLYHLLLLSQTSIMAGMILCAQTGQPGQQL